MSAPALDVSSLPHRAFGHRALTWWGTVGLMCIEGTMFALLIASYFYLKGRSVEWPLSAAPPALRWGTITTVLLALSAIPNQLAKSAAERSDLRSLRTWLVAACVVGVLFSVSRAFEFTVLNVRWDDNAYGSLIWALLGFHTAHIVTDIIDTVVLTAVVFIGPVKETTFVDASENSLYWYFVLGLWAPVYVVIYLVSRFG